MNTRLVQKPQSRSSTGTKGSWSTAATPIEQRAEKSTYLEVAYLLLHGELPTDRKLKEFTRNINLPHLHQREHQEGDRGFPFTTRIRWACSKATLGRGCAFYPDAKDIFELECRWKQILRPDCQGADNRCVSRTVMDWDAPTPTPISELSYEG